jgi:tetratricopeptide (TPR) repeat protein
MRPFLQVAAAVLLAIAVTAAAQTPAEKIAAARKLMETGRREQGIQQMKAVIEELQAALKKDPTRAETHYHLGEAHFYLKQDAEAARHLDKAIELDPKNAAYRLMRGTLLGYTGGPEPAAKEFAEACRLDPNSVECWSKLGWAQMDAHRHEEALASLRKALVLEPKSAKAMHDVGIALSRMERLDEALAMLEKACAADPNSVRIHWNTAQTYQSKGDAKSAAAYFQKVLKIAPDEWQGIAKLVQLYDALGETKRRDAERQRLLALRKAGKIRSLAAAESFCRDQFQAGDRKLIVLEYFELRGERAKRYSFHVLQKGKEQTDYVVSLGSYDATNQIAREAGRLKKGERLFHLDGYYEDGTHKTFGMSRGEPPYDDVKATVVKIVKGELKAVSATIPQAGN